VRTERGRRGRQGKRVQVEIHSLITVHLQQLGDQPEMVGQDCAQVEARFLYTKFVEKMLFLLVVGECSFWRGMPTGNALDFPAWQGAIPHLAAGNAFPVASYRLGCI
jgi:hypothetical protein